MSAELLKSASIPEEEWPDLVPLDTPDLPRLDPKVLPGWAGDYAAALASATETPAELTVGMILVACAAAATRRLRVLVSPGYAEPLNLWIVVALPPGNRKSAVQTAAVGPLIEWENDQACNLANEITACTSERKTQEARANQLRSKAARAADATRAKEFAEEAASIESKLIEIPSIPRLWTSDATPEKLGMLLAENGEQMAWLSSEGGIFDLLQGRYSHGIPNLDLALKAHSGDPERVDRGSRPPIFLQRPCLSIGLSPQPDLLRGLASKPGLRGRGLLARFLYLLPPSPLGYRSLKPTPIPKPLSEAYRAGLRATLEWKKTDRINASAKIEEVRLSREAHAEWHEFAQAIELRMRPRGEMENFTDWAGKAPGAAVRLAGVLHAIQHAHDKPWDHEISRETMASALAIQVVVAKHSLAALDIMGADPAVAAARSVWEWLEGRRLTQIPITEVYKSLRGTFPRMKYLQEACDVLVERGYIDFQEPPPREGPGRPRSPILRINPEMTEAWK